MPTLTLKFPFLFGGTFIEGSITSPAVKSCMNFPSFSEGLSLRGPGDTAHARSGIQFPFLFGGTFIEGAIRVNEKDLAHGFPFLFGGTFIEGDEVRVYRVCRLHFPSFSEGLSLRDPQL